MSTTQTPEVLTHWKALTNPDYIGAYSLLPGEERTVEIVSVAKQPVKGTDGKETQCTVATLKGEKPFILNRTNCKTLTKVFKSPYIENWKGKKIIIYVDPNVKAFGDVVEALRIRPTAPILPTLDPKSPKWPGAVKALKEKVVTVEKIKEQYALTPENEKLLLTEMIKIDQ